MAFMKNLADKINKKLHTDDDEVIEFKKYDEESDMNAVARPEPQGSTLTADDSEKESGIVFKVLKPQTFEEVSGIADYLIDGCTVVLNLELLDPAQTLRMLDFLNGVTYSTDGNIKNVSKSTFIITPHNVDVSDDK